MPVYADREALKNRPDSESWVDIDDVEFIHLGNGDRVAEGPEPITEELDAVTDPEGVFTRGSALPAGRRIVPAPGTKERVFVIAGEVTFDSPSSSVTLKRMQWIDVPPEGGIVRNGLAAGPFGYRANVELVRIVGHWSEVVRTAMFKFMPGKPCDYHYHDGDEYWFVFRGRFQLLLDGVSHEVGPGAIVAAGMGELHGVPAPTELFEGVGFATQLEGRGLDGHLWTDVHGEPPNRR